ncbi:uncharacterized protein [Littorina saxatilis]|uniref:uncharacterized protein n=1 Tax=Littorina saxatilis TaxID=31220 RepID=UPI0038B5CD07
MVLRSLKRHLRLVIVLYLLAFLFLMYLWQTGSVPAKTIYDKTSLLFRSPAWSHKDSLPHSPKLGDTWRILNLDKSSNGSDPYLFIPAERENGTAVDGVSPGGGGKGGGGEGPVGERWTGGGGVSSNRGHEDRTLKARLSSVFTSSLDCPKELPLTFLGMDGQTADLSQDPACPWIKSSVRNAEHNFVALGNEMAVLRDVTLNPKNFQGTRGGEEIASVFGQKEGSEYFKVQRGFFSLPCKDPPKDVKFHVEKQNYRRSNHLNDWLSSLVCTSDSRGGEDVDLAAAASSNSSSSGDGTTGLKVGMVDVARGYVPGVTLALQRYEYANVYHTMLDWYNAFLSVVILGIDPQAATFILVDGHPWGKLDPTWATMFGGRSVLRAGHLPAETTFECMVWVPNGYHCPLFDTGRTQVPFLPQLREHFFRSYGVQASPGPECKRLRLLLVRRRDYLAHPRNPKGRKVQQQKTTTTQQHNNHNNSYTKKLKNTNTELD